MANDPVSLEPWAQDLWKDALPSMSRLHSKTAREDALLFHATAPQNYVQRFRISLLDWMQSPRLCWSLFFIRKKLTSLPSQPLLDKADEILGKIEFGGRLLGPLHRHRIRRNKELYMLSSRETRLALTGAGLIQRRNGEFSIQAQPAWIHWLGRISRDLLILFAATLVAFSITLTFIHNQLLDITVAMIAVSLQASVVAKFMHMIGPQWRKAEKSRHLLQLHSICKFRLTKA